MMQMTRKGIDHAYTSLVGLSVGDAFGEACSYGFQHVRDRLTQEGLATHSWCYTDDTELAIAIYEMLAQAGEIRQDTLARLMAERYRKDPDRGYGKMARMILRGIANGDDWRTLSSGTFSGGSMGNGAAMRSAPLGSYFSDDFEILVSQAAASAQISHYHQEGVAGAIAVALASGAATRFKDESPTSVADDIIHIVLKYTPQSETRTQLQRALAFPADTNPAVVTQAVGNGFQVTSQDTVPFCVWNACRNIDNYREAILSTIEVGGDCDTNGAIVGGIVSCFTGIDGIPRDWVNRCERLDIAPLWP